MKASNNYPETITTGYGTLTRCTACGHGWSPEFIDISDSSNSHWWKALLYELIAKQAEMADEGGYNLDAFKAVQEAGFICGGCYNLNEDEETSEDGLLLKGFLICSSGVVFARIIDDRTPGQDVIDIYMLG